MGIAGGGLSGRAGYACVVGCPMVRSSLQGRAQPQGLADRLAHPPLGPFGPPRCPGQRHELPRPALPLGLRQHVAAPFAG
jgi:hypothetical protein